MKHLTAVPDPEKESRGARRRGGCLGFCENELGALSSKSRSLSRHRKGPVFALIPNSGVPRGVPWPLAASLPPPRCQP